MRYCQKEGHPSQRVSLSLFIQNIYSFPSHRRNLFLEEIVFTVEADAPTQFNALEFHEEGFAWLASTVPINALVPDAHYSKCRDKLASYKTNN